MEISSSQYNLPVCRSIQSLLNKNNTGLLLDKLNENEISRLIDMSQDYLLNAKDNLDAPLNRAILSTIAKYSTPLYIDALEGLAIIVKRNKLSSLIALDNWMEKAEERCLGFLQSAELSTT